MYTGWHIGRYRLYRGALYSERPLSVRYNYASILTQSEKGVPIVFL